jgi:hypothetical protein
VSLLVLVVLQLVDQLLSLRAPAPSVLVDLLLLKLSAVEVQQV